MPKKDSYHEIEPTSSHSGRTIAGLLGLTAFAVAIVVGMSVGNPVSSILTRAVIAMFGSFFLGLIAGRICDFVIDSAIEDYRTANPMVDSSPTVDALADRMRKESESNGEVSGET